ncbi:MAG: hypothetical protein GXX78_01875 [Bacteroidales bacterium]|nr:hypothetical protein [Bacteroidales bacterium]
MSETRLVPMGKLLNLIETAGYKMEYHFDDLVFIDNTSLLFRFDLEDYETVHLHFNTECEATAVVKLIPFLMGLAQDEKLPLKLGSDFILRQKVGTEEIEVIFGN